MRFELKHTFKCDAATLWAITEDPEFERRLGELSQSTREIIESREEGGERYALKRITLQRELPGPMKRVIGGEQITYDQETWRPVDGNKLRWKISPKVLAGRFVGEGSTRVREIGGQCERIIAGNLQVNVPLVGKKMEKRLVEDVSASYERAAGLLQQMLTERG
ncbi:MAG: hypothetical protein ACJAYU_003606 [Bradymonadia bacterium]|jgi:hypothetical protein